MGNDGSKRVPKVMPYSGGCHRVLLSLHLSGAGQLWAGDYKNEES